MTPYPRRRFAASVAAIVLTKLAEDRDNYCEGLLLAGIPEPEGSDDAHRVAADCRSPSRWRKD